MSTVRIIVGIAVFIVVATIIVAIMQAGKAEPETTVDDELSSFTDEGMLHQDIFMPMVYPPYSTYVNPSKDRSLCGKARRRARQGR